MNPARSLASKETGQIAFFDWILYNILECNFNVKRRFPVAAAPNTDFSQGSVWKNIVRMSIPITLAQLINILYNIVDRMYIGHIPGAGALALTGLGLCLPVISIVMAFARLSGMGGGPLCSIERIMMRRNGSWEIPLPC